LVSIASQSQAANCRTLSYTEAKDLVLEEENTLGKKEEKKNLPPAITTDIRQLPATWVRNPGLGPTRTKNSIPIVYTANGKQAITCQFGMLLFDSLIT
jgi:hypothetical protein